jgi:hypothetical protein
MAFVRSCYVNTREYSSRRRSKVNASLNALFLLKLRGSFFRLLISQFILVSSEWLISRKALKSRRNYRRRWRNDGRSDGRKRLEFLQIFVRVFIVAIEISRCRGNIF